MPAVTAVVYGATLPSGPAFTVVLVCHVAAVLIGLVALAAAAVAAASVLAARGRPLSPSVRRYFEPGVNWAGRVLYLVPVFGGALVGMSGGVYPLGAAWVLWGIALWGSAMAVAETVLWPAERRVQRVLQAAPSGSAATTPPGVPPEALRACRTMCLSATAVLVIVVCGMVVMFAKP